MVTTRKKIMPGVWLTALRTDKFKTGCLSVSLLTQLSRDTASMYEQVLWLIPLGVIGCRIYYVIFEWDYYSQHLNEIYRVWDGGIAMYGGIIMGILFLLIWTRKKHFSLGAVLDMDASGMLLAQSIGRWGNFMNREAFGTQTDIFCRMGLTNPGEQTIYVHPTFLYESIWTLIGFIFLNIWADKGHRKYDGQMFIIYVMEGFWGILKREQYYGRRFTSKQELVRMIESYILYYNDRRVQRNLGVLTPMEIHNLALAA